MSLELTLIETKNGAFLSENPSYGKTVLLNYLIDGHKPKLSFHEKWVCVDSEPKKIERFVSQPNINYRYELIDLTLISDKFPAVFKREDVAEYDDGWVWKSGFSHLQSLYREVSDKQDDLIQEVEFTIKNIVRFDEIKKMNGFSYPVQRTQWSSEGFINLTQESVSYELIDQLVNPDIVLPMRPAHITSNQSYKIVRKFIQDNIDPKVAVITSDYDFCFTVKKKISCDPIPYKVDLNAWKRRSKPKYDTRYRNHREITVFEMTHEEYNYKGYKPIPGFKGENIEQLKNNIDEYLQNLIKEINRPLADCPNCKGLGVLESLNHADKVDK